MTLDYFYGQAGKLFSFYRIPKALFQEQRFQNLSTDAKTLYGILLDRMSLSVKNEWFDKQGRVFIIFTIEDVKRALCCADNKATKLLRELENFGLIERKRRGLGKPSLVYVKNFSSDLSNERVQNRENHESGSPKNACQDPPKSRCNKNKKSKTERNNTNPILSDELEKMKNRKLLEEYFSRSLEMDLLLRLYPDDEDMRICTILAGGKKPGEVYFAAIAPDMELTVITLDEAPDILPCFDESDASIHLPDTSLLLCYNPAQVLKMAGKRYLTGPVILVRTNMDGNFISLTIDDVYRFQKFLASHSVTLMADDQKLPCICIV